MPPDDDAGQLSWRAEIEPYDERGYLALLLLLVSAI